VKILIRATNWVGDAIMALPALRAVRSRFPNAEITILARPYVAAIYKNQQVCDNMMFVDDKNDLVDELRAQRFDLALLLQNAFEAAWIAWRAGITERIGYARDGRSLLLTRAVAVPKLGEIPAHEQYYYLELLRRAGWLDSLPSESFIKLNVPEDSRQHAEEFLLSARVQPGSLRIAIGAGASYGSAKCWPPDRFAALANRLQAQAQADVILFGTSTEASVSSAIAAGMSHPPIDLTGKTSIDDLPALLSKCHLFIGNDSGAMHVAAAVGLPVVAVFGPTDPFGTAPVTPHCSVVQEKPHCSPCFLRRCPTDHRCMTRVTPDAVEAAARQWISALEVRPA
jgi:heptosyltransferase II